MAFTDYNCYQLVATKHNSSPVYFNDIVSVIDVTLKCHAFPACNGGKCQMLEE